MLLASATYARLVLPSGYAMERLDVARFTGTQLEHTIAKRQ